MEHHVDLYRRKAVTTDHRIVVWLVTLAENCVARGPQAGRFTHSGQV